MALQKLVKSALWIAAAGLALHPAFGQGTLATPASMDVAPPPPVKAATVLTASSLRTMSTYWRVLPSIAW